MHKLLKYVIIPPKAGSKEKNDKCIIIFSKHMDNASIVMILAKEKSTSD